MASLAGAALRLPRSWCARARDAFFAPADVRSLGLFRLLYCASAAATLVVARGQHDFTVRLLSDHPEAFRPIRLFELLGIGRMPPEAFTALYAGLIAVLCAAAAGLAARWSLIASWVGFFCYYGTIHSMNRPPVSEKIGYKTDSVIFVLWILSIAPEVGRWGMAAWLRREARRKAKEPRLVAGWPLKAALLMLVIPYFGAFWCKLADSFLWGDGLTLQAVLVEHAMSTGNEAGLGLAQSRSLCAAFSVATLLLEGSFGLVLFRPALAWLYAPAGLIMHSMMFAYMDKNYFMYFILPYWAFLRWPGGSSRAAAPTARDLRPASATAFLAALVGLHMAFIFTRSEAWPFSAWSFFAQKKDYTQAVGYRLQGSKRGGGTRWLTQGEIGVARLLTFDYAMRQASERRDYSWIGRQMGLLVQYLPVQTKRELKSVALVRRTAVQAPDGRFRFSDAPFMELSTGAAP